MWALYLLPGAEEATKILGSPDMLQGNICMKKSYNPME